jgi:crotonobetainyl-CoA:carnitine CoA-transferase CaiB-like acyl-CoA transferase
VTTDQQWRLLCNVLDCAELLEDSRFADALSRWQHHDALDPLIAGATRQWESLELMESLQRAGVPAGSALSVDQLWENQHLRERGFFLPYREEDPERTTHELPVVPWRFDEKVEASVTGQPRRGQHNAYMFNELLGLSGLEVEKLQGEGAIY